jgi:hypothetical protein
LIDIDVVVATAGSASFGGLALPVGLMLESSIAD